MKKNFAECPDLGHSAKPKNLFSGKEGEEKNEKKTLPSAQIQDTRQRNKIFFSGKEGEEKKMKKNLCRVSRSTTLDKVKNIFF